VRIPALVLLFVALFGKGFFSRALDEYDPTTLVYPPLKHCLGIHRVTTFHLFVYLGTRTHFNDPEGLAAVKLRAKDDPASRSDDDELTVFGLNSGEGEIIYNTSLTQVKLYGDREIGAGQFRNPLGIAATPEGDVFVADTGNDRIVRLAYRNDALEYVKSFGSTGSSTRQFRSPSQIATGASGTLYVTDTGNDRIVLVTSEGEPLSEIRGDNAAGVALEGPTGLAVIEADDPWITNDLAFIVVSDRGGKRLLQFSREGRLLASVAGGLPVANASFDYLAIDYYGSIYATDRTHCEIHKFDRNLNYVTSFGRCGTDDKELDQPRGITIWRRFGQIFITERAGAQYFWIGTEVQSLEVRPAEVTPRATKATIAYRLTEVSRVTVEVLDAEGHVACTLVQNRRRAIGDNMERWDGTAGRGRGDLAPGSYTVRVTARPTYSSGTYFHDTRETTVKVLAAVPR
jgi:DNA-binding beta-propeller fold protein YncE